MRYSKRTRTKEIEMREFLVYGCGCYLTTVMLIARAQVPNLATAMVRA